jgi:septum formation protein
MRQLILASSSPARRTILDDAKVDFMVDASNYEEDMGLDMPPSDLAIFLSKGKARDVAKRHPDAVILGADSFAVFNEQLLGKPHTYQRAKEMLTMLSGKAHTFVTGFTVIDTATDHERSGFVETKVYFNTLTPEDIDNYLSKEDVLERAAAYTTQGLGAILVSKIEGDYFNIVGLPIATIAVVLKDFDVNLLGADV